jgi:hypothetical protein
MIGRCIRPNGDKIFFQGHSVHHINGLRCGTCSPTGDRALILGVPRENKVPPLVFAAKRRKTNLAGLAKLFLESICHANPAG